ncbi:MAG: hypothetical protein QOF48_2726 [Verrucomicrobiota bacterium]|jgi:hypothetical protein
MGIAQKRQEPSKHRRPVAKGWPPQGWHVLFFAAGILLTFLGQLALSSVQKRKPLATNDAPSSISAALEGPRSHGPAKPWGDLQITPMVLDRPDEFFDGKTAAPSEIRWCFPGHTPEQLTQLICSCDLTEGQKSALLNTNRWQLGTNGWRIWPPREVVTGMCESAREKIYSILARCPENPQCFPFTCREDRFGEMFEGCELSSEKVALVRKLCYRKSGLLYFADAQLFELSFSSNETRCLFKTLLRVPTMLVKVRVEADSDINALIDYWDFGGRAQDLRPLLHALSRMPGGGSINVSYFLPPVPRLHLYTYPHLTNGLPLDCFWTSFNFFSEKPGYRLGDQEYADWLLHSDYSRVQGEKRFGDVLILLEAGYAMHACVYIADDIYYTKNGTDPNQPWVLMKMKDMLAQYTSGQPQEWRVYRRKTT